MPEVPKLFGMVGRHGFVMEKMDGVRLPRRKQGELSPEFFDALKSSLLKMNRLGVVHGDLRRKNILVDPQTQNPMLIDFGTAIVAGESAGWLRRTLWRKTRRIDRLHYAKLKEYYLPGHLTREEKVWLANAPWYYRLGSFFRSRVYRRLKPRHLRKAFKRG
jgi:serine/threonine protein kinase